MDKSKWYFNSIFYQIYFPSFQDSNSDGVGDLEGIISRKYEGGKNGILAEFEAKF